MVILSIGKKQPAAASPFSLLEMFRVDKPVRPPCLLAVQNSSHHIRDCLLLLSKEVAVQACNRDISLFCLIA